MTVKLPLDLETHIAEKASAEGITVDAYVERIMRDATERQGARPNRCRRGPVGY